MGNRSIDYFDVLGLSWRSPRKLKNAYMGPEGCFCPNLGGDYTDFMTKWLDADKAKKVKSDIGYEDHLAYTADFSHYNQYEAILVDVPKSECASCKKWVLQEYDQIVVTWFHEYEGTAEEVNAALERRWKTGFKNRLKHDPKAPKNPINPDLPVNKPEGWDDGSSGKATFMLSNREKFGKWWEWRKGEQLTGRCATDSEKTSGKPESAIRGLTFSEQ